MSKQIISMMNDGKALTVSELSELLVNKLANGILTGKEVMADFDNSDCCMMGLKKKGNIVMCAFESENEEYLSFLEREGFFNTDRCDPYDDVNEIFDAIEELENANDDIIETVEKLEGEKNDKQ